ncbi:SDR family NAD(P)-dependent oxidoreductase [Phycicoccus sp. Soil803]|uniref:SDR family NAD(P)-dependent oxidoreductase n=1 Tax=Phycicoccus sp. Soil803 TaxID=1736415 RepID=UPI00070D0E99|nr:SDR family NAD(P)-dependent oxidoreductase [Phycicoccus sp. Soil803]KRF24391.1 short-chain dehydrogenase [Phycicoccus sp. Soil803]
MSDHGRPHRIDVEGARVLVTGASSGVGEATAKLLANRGATVALLGRRVDQLQRVASDIGPAAHSVAVDVSDSESVQAAVSAAIEVMGGLDVAINAAGIASLAALEDLTDAVWREVVETNLSGTFFVSRAAGLHMKAAGRGSIVNVASDLASMGVAGLAHYCAAKAGVVGLTRGLALELAPIVRVNVVCPGPIDTPMLRGGLDEADPERSLREKEATVPLNRLAQPEEVALAISFLAFDGTFATGTSMALDGGTSAA